MWVPFQRGEVVLRADCADALLTATAAAHRPTRQSIKRMARYPIIHAAVPDISYAARCRKSWLGPGCNFIIFDYGCVLHIIHHNFIQT